MANQHQIEAMYDWVDYFHTLRLGPYADFSCAYFNGDFNKTLDQAQHDKQAWVLEGIGFQPGQRIIDIGSGWGNMLQAVRQRGGQAVGLTLSRAQTRYATGQGLTTFLQDWKNADPGSLGKFDGAVSIGAFEHFCSDDEYLAGEQERIYQDFFRFCSDVLPPGGKLYLQTMIWGETAPDPRTRSLQAAEGSTDRILARLEKFYPGSWLPKSKQQVITTANPYFNFLYSSNGRLDYIETLDRWDASTKNLFRPSRFGKALIGAVRLVPRFIRDPDFRIQVESVRRKNQQVCFQKEIMTHERMFFQKR